MRGFWKPLNNMLNEEWAGKLSPALLNDGVLFTIMDC